MPGSNPPDITRTTNTVYTTSNAALAAIQAAAVLPAGVTLSAVKVDTSVVGSAQELKAAVAGTRHSLFEIYAKPTAAADLSILSDATGAGTGPTEVMPMPVLPGAVVQWQFKEARAKLAPACVSGESLDISLTAGELKGWAIIASWAEA